MTVDFPWNVVIPLFSGLLGALLVFCLGVLKDACRQVSELKGLLRLIDAEMGLNEIGLDKLSSNGFEAWATEAGRPLELQVWKEARVRLAQLLTSSKFRDLVAYYSKVEELNYLLVGQHVSPKQRQEQIPPAVVQAQDDSRDIRAWIDKDYVASDKSNFRSCLAEATRLLGYLR